MKITKIETLVCNARMRNWIFVKVLTDQPGLYGWGEATLEWHTRGVVGAIEDIAPLLIGEDPTRIEHLWQMMYRQHFWHGNGIVRGTAISGIDIALWDILGKVHGVPCHKLWGGPVRDYVRTLLPSRRRQDGRLLRDCDPADAEPLRRSGPAGRRRRLHRVQVHGRARNDAARRPAADPLCRSVRAARCARPSATRSTSWSIATPGPRRAWGCCSPRRWSRTACTSSKSRAGRRTIDGLADDPARGGDADRHRRAAGRASTRSASCWRSGRAASCSPTSRIAAA